MIDEAQPVEWPSATGPASQAALERKVSIFYEATREDLYRYLVIRGVNAGPAQEFAQEAFLRLYQALAAGEAIRNERAWVFTVAHNLAENWRNAETPARNLELDTEFAAGQDDTSPELRMIAAQRLRRVRDAVAGLSPQQRQCLHLRAEGFRYREIGGILGIGTSTVSEFLRRAIQRLRSAVEG